MARDGGLRAHDEMSEDAEQLLEGDFPLDGRDSCREAGSHCLFGDGCEDGGGHGVGFSVTFRSFVVISLIFLDFCSFCSNFNSKVLKSI